MSRFAFLNRVLRRSHALWPAQRILDVGSGDAWFAQQLAARSYENTQITCWDSGYGESIASQVEKSAARMEWRRERPRQEFDLLLLLDVLEHIADDGTFLNETVRLNAAPGSFVLVTVPCWPYLFSAHDVHLRHMRRYRPAECRDLLTSSGLRILKEGGFYHSLLVFRVLAVLAERIGRWQKPPDDLGQWNVGSFATCFVTGTLKVDNAFTDLFSRLGLCVPGLSYWALCQKTRPS